MAKKRVPKSKTARAKDGVAQKQKQKHQQQSQTVIVNVGKRQRGAKKSAPSFPPNFPPSFPPGFNPMNNPNWWATPPPPIPQRPRAAFVEGEVAELLNQSKTEPVRLTFEGGLAERLVEPARVAPLAEYTAPPIFEPPPEVGFTEPEPTPEEIARNEAALAKEARAAELAAEKEAAAAAAEKKILAEGLKTMASFAAIERGAAAAREATWEQPTRTPRESAWEQPTRTPRESAWEQPTRTPRESALPFAAEPEFPTSAEELAGPRGVLVGAPESVTREADAKPSKSKKKGGAVAEGPVVPSEEQNPRYKYNRYGQQYFYPSGAPVKSKSKEAAEELPPIARDFVASSFETPGGTPFVSGTFPPLVVVRGASSVNSEPLRFLGSSSLPEKPSGLERTRREGFAGKSSSGSVLSGAEETLLSSGAVSANWPY